MPTLEKLANRKESFAIRILESRPELFPDLMPVWKAWNDLSRARRRGFAIEPLSISDIAAYMDMIQLSDVEEREEWFYLLTELDVVFMTAMAERDASKRKK